MASDGGNKTYDNVKFDWVQLSADLDPTLKETFMEKASRKFKENPFVYIGAIGAVGALTFGLASMVTGNKKHSQAAMRARVGFQGFAIASLIVGFIIAKPAKNPR